MDLSGKICLITGASSGLGLETSRALVARNAKVIMLCRNRLKGEAAIAGIRSVYPNAQIDLLLCDLASFVSVRNCLEKIHKNCLQLDVLINNAAVLQSKETSTADGLSMMLQTNYLSPFLFNTELMKLLKKSDSATIINIALPSAKLRLKSADIQDAARGCGLNAFFRIKLLLLLHALELSRREEYKAIRVLAIDPGPGMFKSDLGRDFPWWMRVANRMIAKSPRRAAENIALAIAETGLPSGSVIAGRRQVKISAYWEDRSVAEMLRLQTISLLERSGWC